MARIRILLVDDHAMFRDGLRAVLEHADDMDLVGETGDGETAIALAAGLQPDIVLMDLHMPGLGGIEATRAITTGQPRVKVIALSMYQDDELIANMIGAGALGYVLKDARAIELLQAIRAVAVGGAALDPALLSQVLVQFRRLARDETHVAAVVLSKREVAILQGLVEGLSNREVAKRLHLSQQTIKNTLSEVYLQLGVSNRTEAVVEALRRGILRPPS
jgi:NarL family two-component system response regulator LiaR